MSTQKPRKIARPSAELLLKPWGLEEYIEQCSCFNLTELQQMMRERALSFPSHATKTDLITALYMESNVPAGQQREIDAWRDKIAAFLLEHWASVAVQMKCHARFLRHPTQQDDRPCYKCTDGQVAVCVAQNMHSLSLPVIR